MLIYCLSPPLRANMSVSAFYWRKTCSTSPIFYNHVQSTMRRKTRTFVSVKRYLFTVSLKSAAEMNLLRYQESRTFGNDISIHILEYFRQRKEGCWLYIHISYFHYFDVTYIFCCIFSSTQHNGQ